MLKEAAHKLHDLQLHRTPAVTLRLSIFEEDLAILDFDDAAI